jgi:hypothetical protein
MSDNVSQPDADLLPMPPASGQIIEVFLRQKGEGGGLGSGLGGGVGAGVGLLEPGNIDLQNRPRVRMEDGSTATIRSMGVNIDGREVLVPTVSDDGRVMSDDEAVETYRRTGRHLGIFATPEASSAYAERLSADQGRMLGQQPAVEVEVVGRRPAPPSMLGTGDAAPIMLPAEVEGRFASRFWERTGVLPPAPEQPATEMRAQPDPAGFDAIRSPTEPRRGTLRLSPGGTPQLPEGLPLPPVPPEPEMVGPQQPAEPIGANLLREDVTNLMLAMRQGVTSSALNMAEPVDDYEMRRRLEPAFNDDGPVAERLAAARERAAELGIEVAFRAGRDGRIEAVARTPDMAAPGGAPGRVADALGRLFGLGFVDPVGGAVALGARGAAPAAGVASAGGAGPRASAYARATRAARSAVDQRINQRLPRAEGAIMAMTPEGHAALREASQAAYREELLRAIDALPEAERTAAILEHMRRTEPSLASTVATLTPDEARLVTTRNVNSMMRQLLQIRSAMPSVDEVAAVAYAGRAKRGWYANSARAIVEVFGREDARRFAALLAATSPQTSVESNLVNALRIWVNWDRAGRPTDGDAIRRIMGQSVQGGRGEDSILDAWINNSVTALSSDEPMRIVLSGPKVNSFMLNLVDEVDEVTNDAWIANYTGILQDLFAKAGNDPGKGVGYLAASALQREAAALLTQRTGVTWTPREIQETVWSFAKTAYESVYSPGPGREALAPRVTDAIAQGRLTHDMIGSTPDFELLFLEGAYRTFLEAAGYGDRLRTIERSVEGRAGAGGVRPGESGPASAEGSGFGADEFSRLLEQAGKRLDDLAARRTRASQYNALRADVSGGRPDAFPAAAYSPAGGGVSQGDLRFPRLGTLEPGDVAGVHEAAPQFLEGQRRLGAQPVERMIELAADNERAASLFATAITRVKRGNQRGAAVHVYTPEEYRGMRLFLTPDGAAGFALKGDDIVSLFSRNDGPYRGAAVSMLNLAVQQGGRRLDAFDTELPHVYSRAGFRVVSRIPFNDTPGIRPDGWRHSVFREFNDGRPDVVFMAWNPNDIRLYSNRAEGRLFGADQYDRAAAEQKRAVERVNRRLAGQATGDDAAGTAADDIAGAANE